ncbi:lipid A oxidase [Roseovarius nanhaiticus]|uniref:Lipid A oxidase n=2 Tax=Roseovarius nanhaiticus TaxID=573024 RepID=A0A1N7ECC0_9RHOB|nr:lipid A oxidase [Roseovarius nanhaiticus]SIR85813.1 lipid A oxidase [Roseovarius nanhaiticus]
MSAAAHSSVMPGRLRQGRAPCMGCTTAVPTVKAPQPMTHLHRTSLAHRAATASKSAAAIAALVMATPAAAELELSFYLGTQTASDSDASGFLPNGAGVFDRNVSWDGKSFDAPIYYGGRAMWWTSGDLGFGIEGTHTKAYASAGDKAAIGVDRLEFTDGHNIITANVMKRYPGAFGGSKFTPYGGAGIGVAIPHVDILTSGATNRTYDYEVTGLALRGIAGMKYELTEDWALFGEYQITWSDNDVTIDGDPGQPDGKLRTELLTHAVNIGISYSF